MSASRFSVRPSFIVGMLLMLAFLTGWAAAVAMSPPPKRTSLSNIYDKAGHDRLNYLKSIGYRAASDDRFSKEEKSAIESAFGNSLSDNTKRYLFIVSEQNGAYRVHASWVHQTSSGLIPSTCTLASKNVPIDIVDCQGADKATFFL